MSASSIHFSSASSLSTSESQDCLFDLSLPSSPHISQENLEEKTNNIAQATVFYLPEYDQYRLIKNKNSTSPISRIPPPLPTTAYRNISPPSSLDAPIIPKIEVIESIKTSILSNDSQNSLCEKKIDDLSSVCSSSLSSPIKIPEYEHIRLLKDLTQVYAEKVSKLEIEKKFTSETINKLKPQHEEEWKNFISYEIGQTTKSLSQKTKEFFLVLRSTDCTIAKSHLIPFKKVYENLKNFTIDEGFKDHPVYKKPLLLNCPSPSTPNSTSISLSSSYTSDSPQAPLFQREVLSLKIQAFKLEEEIKHNHTIINHLNQNHDGAILKIRIAVYFSTIHYLIETLQACEKDLLLKFGLKEREEKDRSFSNLLPLTLQQSIQSLREDVNDYMRSVNPNWLTGRASQDFLFFMNLEVNKKPLLF